jgi:DNA polymerase
MRHVSIDLETYSSVDIKKSGAHAYTRSPDFEILLMAYKFWDWGSDAEPVVVDFARGTSEAKSVRDFIGMLTDPSIIKHAYNATFEWLCFSRFLGELPKDQWRDTMLQASYYGYPLSLDAVGKALGLPEDKRKMAEGKALIRYFCNPCKPTKVNGQRTRNHPEHDPVKWQTFIEYNRQDVVTEVTIAQLLPEIPAELQWQWQTDLTINCRGVKVDTELVDGALEVGATATQKLSDEAMLLSGVNNPNSVSQLSAWLTEHVSEPVSNLQKATVQTMLDGTDIDSKARRVLEIRQELGKTSTKKYDAVKTCICADNRVRGMMQFYGANRSGRWAGRLVQLQNLPRTYLDPLPLARELVKRRSYDGLRLIYGSVNDTLSQLIRTAFVASDGNILIDADFSAIEARVISWLAGEEWRLDVFRTHGKIYEASASQMFGVPIEKIKKGNPEYALRAKGKVAELALGYQGGASALISMGALNMGLHEEELQDIIDRWRTTNPHIQQMWWDFNTAVINAIKCGTVTSLYRCTVAIEQIRYDGAEYHLVIQLPSGRKLYYTDPRIGTNRFGGESIIYKGMAGSKTGVKKYGDVETYGGKIVENITQAVARDCLAEAIERLEAAGYPVVFHIHDEVVIDIRPYAEPDKMLQDVVSIMSIAPSWAQGLPLGADGWTGDYFKKD